MSVRACPCVRVCVRVLCAPAACCHVSGCRTRTPWRRQGGRGGHLVGRCRRGTRARERGGLGWGVGQSRSTVTHAACTIAWMRASRGQACVRCKVCGPARTRAGCDAMCANAALRCVCGRGARNSVAPRQIVIPWHHRGDGRLRSAPPRAGRATSGICLWKSSRPRILYV